MVQLTIGGEMKVEREVDESFHLHAGRGENGKKKIDLNDLLKRAKEEKKENSKNNILIFSGVATVCAAVLLVLSL